jgi:2,4-dienoyl-CoA reductase-like NADH-dependent reductase (Old Yellow Enzyme family)
MAEAVANGDIDMCGLGRPLREDPEFVNSVLSGKTLVSKL